MVTTFLVVLTAALIIGHLLIYLYDRNKQYTAGLEGASLRDVKNALENTTNTSSLYERSKIKIAEQKIDMAHARLEKLEKMLLTLKGVQMSVKTEQRIKELEKFKANCEVELEGIKEMLFKLSGKGKKKGSDISGKKLHQLAFGST